MRSSPVTRGIWKLAPIRPVIGKDGNMVPTTTWSKIATRKVGSDKPPIESRLKRLSSFLFSVKPALTPIRMPSTNAKVIATRVSSRVAGK